MIICHSVLSVDILLELKSRNSDMLATVCICLLFIVCNQYLLFLFSLMNSKIKKIANKSNNMLKGSYTMIKWDLSQEYEDFSISANQSV